MRAALYARYSSDRQRETSIDDQLRLARERAERDGWQIVATYTDESLSGATPVALRPGGKALLSGAMARQWDVLVLESLDRLVRDVGEQETVVKRLEHRQLRIVGYSDGYDTLASGRKVMRLARGMVNEMFLDDLKAKTHRGLRGQFERGLSAGGRTYGYTSEDAAIGRRMIIDEEQALHVRWIFQRFAEGWSVQRIARALNERGVPSPRGSSWAVSALWGSAAQGTGLLNNELYIGRVIWNRRQWIKDPETGRRTPVERPQSEWQVREQPELRIIDQALWDATRVRTGLSQARGAATAAALVKRGRPARSLFGGLLLCGACGGPVIAVNRERYGCNVHKDRGPTVCANKSTVKREVLDRRLIAEVRDELLAGDAIAELQAAVHALLVQQRREAAQGSEAARKRLQALEGEIGRLVDAVATVGVSPALSARLKAAEAERAQLEAEIQASGPVDLAATINDVTGRYKRMLLQLQQVLEGEDRDRTRQILAEMIGPVTVLQEGGEPFAELEEPAERLLLAAVGESLNVVAGARSCIKKRIRLQ